MVGAQQYDVNQDAWRDLLYPKGSEPSMNSTTMSLGTQSSNNSAITQMAQELIEYRKGSTVKEAESQKLVAEKEELLIQNMQMQQQNKVLQNQLQLLQEKQMRSNQLSGIYNGTSGGKKLI